MAGEIVHIELRSSDFARSAAFYGKLFGWRSDGAQAGGHLLFEAPGGVGGSWIRAALTQAPGPVPFVAVDDLEEALAAVEKEGGRILVRRLALANRGAFGLFSDPDGNVVAVLATKGSAAVPAKASEAPVAASSAAAAPAKAPAVAAAGKP